MSDQTHTAPQAPQPSVMNAPATASKSRQEVSHHATQPVATTPAQPVATASPAGATPATAPSATSVPLPASHNVSAEPPTLNETLNSRDRYWKFKTALQVVTIIVGIIGIGGVAWLVKSAPVNEYVFYSYELASTWPCLITFAISIVWCLTCILVLVARKRPVHPGLRVAMDLLLWLGFIVTGMFAIFVLQYVMDWGTYGNFGFSSTYGDYELASNGTWVWQNDSSYSSRPRDCNRSSSYSSYGFSSCAEQDAYVNDLWRNKPHRVSIILMAVVCQFIVLALHFVLFVWACVDEHHRRHNRVSQDAEKLAASIVQTMIQNGAIIPPPGQAHMKPIPYGQPGNYHLQPGQMYPMAYPQGYVMQYNQPGQHLQQGPPGHPAMQQNAAPPMAEQRPNLPPRPVVAGPSNEKSEGPRYA